jgi:hypothetical protein
MGVKLGLPRQEEHRLRVFGNRVLRRIFVPKREEVVEDWREMHNEELHNLYNSPNIIRVIKSRRMRWAGNVTQVGEMHTKFWQGKLTGRNRT